MSRIRRGTIAAVLMMLTAGLTWSLSADDKEARKREAEEPAVYELRTYTTHPGRLPALHQRFREHTMRLFEKHGMENVIYWTPTDKEETLVYVLRHKSVEDAKRSWQAYREDPEWVRVKTASEAEDESGKGGPIVKEVVSQYLTPTEYSPIPVLPAH